MISLDDVKLLLKVKNITISLTDTELTNYIKLIYKEVYSLLGIDSEYSNHTYSLYFKNYHKHITLPLSDVVEVYKISNKGEEIDASEYTVELDTGIIHMKKPDFYFDCLLTIEYITLLPDYIIKNIDILVKDLVVDGVTPASSRDIKSIEEGDVTVDYVEGNNYSINQKIDDIKNEIKNYLHHDTVMMI